MSLFVKGCSFLVVGGGTCAIPFLKFPVSSNNTPVVATVNHSSGGGQLSSSLYYPR